MAVSFSSKGLNSISSSNYTLEQFNGVDYTTTPTKVTDDKAIKISNYLPEGNSLVKRYGYKIIGNLSSIPYAHGLTTSITQKIVSIDKYVVVLTKDSENKKLIQFLEFNGEYFTNHNFYLLNQNEGINNFDSCILLKGEEKTYYLFAFGYYFKISYNTGTITPVYTYSAKWLIEIVNENNAYIPKIALNYQPENSQAKSIPYQQLNILTPVFKVELYFEAEATESGTGIVKTLKKYDIGSLVGTTNFSLDKIEYEGTQDNEGTIECHLNGELVDENARGGSTSTISFSQNGTYVVADLQGTSVISVVIQNDPRPEYKLKGPQYGKFTITCKILDTSYIDKAEDFLQAKVGTVYGVKNSADRFFVGNTPNAKNTDWHTLDDETGKPNFTYFGTDTYNAIGSSDSEIVGYSLLNDGSMVVLKEPNDTSNIFVRNGRIDISTEEYTVGGNEKTTYSYVKSEEIYSTITTGLLVKTITKDTKICLYDNKLIFNAKDGIYYLNLNATTSNQSYAAKELSYYIRGDLSNDITNSAMATDGNFLYVARKNKKGQLRVYVADKHRYGFVNSEEQYHWWVLDGIPAYHFLTINDELYFANEEYYICSFKNDSTVYDEDGQFVDNQSRAFSNVSIGDEVISTDLAFDTDEDKMIIAPSSPTWERLLNIYQYNANIDKDNIGEKLKYIKDNVYIQLEGVGDYLDAYYSVMDLTSMFNSVQPNSTDVSITFTISQNDDNLQKKIDFIYGLKGKTILYNYGNSLKKCTAKSDIDISANGNLFEYKVSTTAHSTYGENRFETNNSVYLVLTNNKLKIKELYDENNRTLSDYFYIPNSGWYNATNGDFVATTLNFNKASFSFLGMDVNFATPLNNVVSYAAYYIKAPVQSSWYGKYTDLGRYDILKTTNSIHFVPETRRGGYTQVGYRTRKTKTMNADTSGTYTLSKYLIDIAKERTTLSRYFVSNDLGINLSDVDFNNFSFESDVFARTYSSKKKIKNFSFIQLKFTSDTAEDSTIASVDIKYTYTKENKGVK